MRTPTTLSLLFILFPVLFSCQKKPEQETVAPALTESRRQEILQQGGEASGALLATLGPKLKAAMMAGGPEHALEVCQKIGQPLTREISDNLAGLTLSRVSLKPRNPANAPDGLDTEILTEWQKAVTDEGVSPSDEVRVKDGKVAVFYRPIIIQNVCLKCHGDPETFSETLTAKLDELYPDDKATGYSMGKLRGAFRIEFPLVAD